MQNHTASIAKTVFAAALFGLAANAHAGGGSRPDLTVDVTGPAAVDVSTTVHYNVAVKNQGSKNASSTIATINLPANATFLQASTACSASGNTLTCNLGTVTTNMTRNLAVEVIAPANADTLHLSASANTSTRESSTRNNDDAMDTVVNLLPPPPPVGPDIVLNPTSGNPVQLRVQDCWEPMSLAQCPPEMIMNDLVLPLNDDNSITTGDAYTVGVWSQPDNKTIVMDFYGNNPQYNQNNTHLSHFTATSIDANCFEGTFEYYTAVHSSTWRGCVVQ